MREFYMGIQVRRFAASGLIGAIALVASLVLAQGQYFGPGPFTETEAGLKTGTDNGCLGVIQTTGFNSLGGKYTKTITVKCEVKSGPKTPDRCKVGTVQVKLAGGDQLWGTVVIRHQLDQSTKLFVETTYTGGTGRFTGAKGSSLAVIEAAPHEGNVCLYTCEQPVAVTGATVAYLKHVDPPTE
jgi:hypothetical protein